MSHPQRLERLRSSFDTHRVDGLLVSQPESRYYLSGYTGHDLPPRDSAGYLLITTSKAILLTDARTTEQAEHESPEFEVVSYGSSNMGPRRIAELASKVGIGRLGFEAIHLPYAVWDSIKHELSGSAELVPDDRVIDDLRVIKDADE